VTHLVRRNDAGALEVAAQREQQLKDALEVLESLRVALLDGRIKAFFAVGLAADHRTFGWCGKAQPTTLLEMHGAWHAMADRIGDSF
jgi:hypothetical protein